MDNRVGFRVGRKAVRGKGGRRFRLETTCADSLGIFAGGPNSHPEPCSASNKDLLSGTSQLAQLSLRSRVLCITKLEEKSLPRKPHPGQPHAGTWHCWRTLYTVSCDVKKNSFWRSHDFRVRTQEGYRSCIFALFLIESPRQHPLGTTVVNRDLLAPRLAARVDTS